MLRNDDGKFQQVLQQNNNNKVKNVGPKGHFHALATATASLISFIKMLEKEKMDGGEMNRGKV